MLTTKTKNSKGTKKMSHSDDYNDQAKLEQLCWDAVEFIDNIYEYFNIDIKYRNDQLIKSACPVHGGDNPVACNFYPAGDHVVHWKCRTHNCEDHFGKTMIGFIKGCLSRASYDWEKDGDREATFKETVDFLLEITGQKFGDIKQKSNTVLEMKQFNTMVWTMFGEEEDKPDTIITRDFYRSKTEIPAQYYLDRGYSAEILDKYDVGFCSTRGKQMHNRCIVPIYSHDMDYIVGFSGRSVFDQCPKCKFYHDPEERCKFFPKWRHSKGFQKEKWLYNYWYAKDHISKTGVAIIVESPGNVWRLEEAGIHNSVAIFGTALNQSQKDLLDGLGAMSLIILMDNDEAGENAASKIIDTCSNQYRIYKPIINTNDIGEMNLNDIRSLILPQVLEAKEYYK